MKKRQLKKSVVYSLYGISFTLLLSGVVLLGMATKEATKTVYDFVTENLTWDNISNKPCIFFYCSV